MVKSTKGCQSPFKNPLFTSTLRSKIFENLSDIVPQHLSNIVYAYAIQKEKDQDLFGAISDEIAKRAGKRGALTQFKSQELSNIL